MHSCLKSWTCRKPNLIIFTHSNLITFTHSNHQSEMKNQVIPSVNIALSLSPITPLDTHFPSSPLKKERLRISRTEEWMEVPSISVSENGSINTPIENESSVQEFECNSMDRDQGKASFSKFQKEAIRFSPLSLYFFWGKCILATSYWIKKCLHQCSLEKSSPEVLY